MPLKYKIIESKKLIYAVGEGEINCDELIRHFDELSEDPKYTSPMKKLVDYRNATIANLTREEAHTITLKKEQLKNAFKNEMCAIITHTDADFGLSRAHGAYIEKSDIEVNVFRNIHDALLWLQVDVDEKELGLQNISMD